MHLMKFVKFIPFLIILLTAINLFWLSCPILGLLTGLIYFSFFSFLIRAKFFSQTEKFPALCLGFLLLLCYLVISTSLFYYLTGLHLWNLVIIIFLPLLLLFKKTVAADQPAQPLAPPPQNNKRNFIFLFGSYLLLISGLIYFLFTHRSTEALISPWQVLPSYFFILYFLASLILLLLNNLKPTAKILPLIILHTFISATVALVIYQIGFGFDPFVHRAAEKIILNQGAILPKTPYYIGQYGLIFFLSKFLSLNFVWLDKILAPLLGSILIPLFTYFSLYKKSVRSALLLATLLPLLVLFTFFFTTPQYLANIFLIILILVATNSLFSEKKLFFSSLLILAVFFIHPLAGLPAALFFCLNLCAPKKRILLLLTLLALFVVPLAFLFASKFLPTFSLSFQPENFKTLFSELSPSSFYLSFSSFLTSLYLLKNFFPLLLILGASLIFWSNKKDKTIQIIFLTILVLIFNALILRLFNFNSVIFYEQTVFPQRLLDSAYFFLLPLILIFLKSWLDKFSAKPLPLWTLISLAFIFVCFFYFSYPVFDNLQKDRGFSVSRTDLTAVRLVEGLGADKNYLILANQSTSAAALQEFGFKKYFSSRGVIPTPHLRGKDLVFYYPLPTSSPLYQIYLDLTYQGIKPELIAEAKKITGAETVYLIFNDYWTNFKKLIPAAKLSARHSFEINAGKIWVFEY